MLTGKVILDIKLNNKVTQLRNIDDAHRTRYKESLHLSLVNGVKRSAQNSLADL